MMPQNRLVARFFVRWVLRLPLTLSVACSDPQPVTFGLPSAPDGEKRSATRGDPPWSRATATAAARTDVTRTFADPPQRLVVEGAELPLPDGAYACALFAGDSDHDGDRDALLVVAQQQSFQLTFARRDGDRFEALAPMTSPREFSKSSLPTDPPPDMSACCRGVGVHQPSPAWVAFSLGPCPMIPHPLYWVVAVSGDPQLQLSLATPPVSPPVALSFRAAQIDDDSHDDVIATLAFTEHAQPEDGGPWVAEAFWLNRPNGLSFDAARTERSFRAAATAWWSRAKRLGNAERAQLEAMLPGVQQLSHFRSMTCGPGFPACVASEALAAFLSLESYLTSKVGAVSEALLSLDRLGAPTNAVGARERALAEAALTERSKPVARIEEGPAVALRTDPARLAPFAFVDEQHILLRTSPPALFDLASGELASVTPDTNASRDIIDPSGHWRVATLSEPSAGCATLTTEATGAPAMGMTRFVLIEGNPSQCPLAGHGETTREQSGDQRKTAWRALGWAPQGILAERFGELRLVPMGPDGSPAGAPQGIPVGDPAPAPVLPGAMTRAGDHVVRATVSGILWRRSDSASVALLRPPDWGAALANTPVAISPTGARIAYSDGTRLRLFRTQDAGASR